MFQKLNRFYLGVFAISGLLMALQLLQARIFSVTTWYHISFLVISIAMFGLTMGALTVYRGDEKYQRENYGLLMARATRLFAVSIVSALAAQLLIPLVSAGSIARTLLTLPIVSYFIVWPYYHAGIILSLAITRAPYPVNRTYGIDLLGAAAGCLFALAIMNTIDAPSAVLLLSIGAFASIRCFSHDAEETDKKKKSAVMYEILVVLVINLMLPWPLIYPYWVKDTFVPHWELAHDEWNAISRVTVDDELKDVGPFLWGASHKLPEDIKTSFYYLKIDGGAATPITHYASGTSLDYLDYDLTTLAYALPGIKSTGIIGLGGGRDVLSAYHAGATSITALDVNNVQVELLSHKEPFASYAGLTTIPGLKMIHSEARSWFSHTDQTFDLIQMSLIDTWAATGAGAFALSENGLYTVEAFKTFISHLNEHGVLTVSRWYISDAHSETERMLSLATASLLANGAHNPEQHLYMAAADRIATLVLSRDPFTEQQLDALDERVRQMDFKILISPRKTPSNEELASIIQSTSVGHLDELNKNSVYDISPPTDNRPFFFNQVRLTQPWKVLQLIYENNASSQLGHARAIFNLYIILIFSLAMVTGVIILPLRAGLRQQDKGIITAGSMWFMLIGLGFMLCEIALMQRMSVYLGHPSYGLGVVLFSLVFSTGLGSLMSNRLPLSSMMRCVLWAVATCGILIGEIYLIDIMFAAFDDTGILLRAMICVGLIFPLGILFGYGFPTGMELVGKDKGLTAWFWGINGAAGVMGSAIAISISIAAGLHTTMLAGAVCYGLLAIPAIMLSRHKA